MGSVILAIKGKEASEIEAAESAALSYSSFWKDLESLSEE